MLAIIRALDDMQAFGQPGDRRGLLVLDETTVFLPHDGREQLLDLLRRISRTSASILFVSHDTAAVKALCTQAVLMEHGRVVEVGDPDDVVNRYHARVAASIAPGDYAEAAPEEIPAAERDTAYTRMTDKRRRVLAPMMREVRRG